MCCFALAHTVTGMHCLVRHTVVLISLVPRPLPDFISQPWRKIHGCEIKSGSGLGTRLGFDITVKPLITDLPKSGQPLYNGRLTCPRFYHRTNTFRTSEKRTPLNSERTLISLQRTLANTKLPPKTGSEDNADACRLLSLRHRC